MKISVSSYSFQQYIRQGKLTQYDTVEEARKIGLEAIEFIDLSPKDGATLDEQKEYAFKIKQRADELGMTINAYTIGANLFRGSDEENEKEVKRLCDQLDVAKILGASVMRHDVCYSLTKTGLGRSFDLMLPTIAANARKVTEYGATLGIKTCSENHGTIAQDSDRVERLVNAVNHDNYGLLVDFGNFSCVDEDNVTAVSRVAPYAFHAHAKDMHKYSGSGQHPGDGLILTRGGNWLRGAIIGQGNVPVKQCIRIMKRAGYDGYLSIEFEGKEDCILGISTGFANLKKYISEVESEFAK